MARWRSGPLVSAVIDLYPPSRASVALVPAAGRWPEHEPSDRLSLCAGMAASAFVRIADDAAPGFGGSLRAAATRLVSDDGRSAEDARSLVDWDEPGRPRVTVQLARSSIGPVPRLGRAAWSSGELSLATLALLEAVTMDAQAPDRLGVALTLEGLIGYYRHADPNFQPPQQAVAFALRYASMRLGEAGHAAPPCLEQAAAAHRSITPMAGGA